MKTKLVNPTDDQLNEAFAEHVAGWKCVRGDALTPCYFWSPEGKPVGLDKLPTFTQSADAVLPWIEKASQSRAMFVDTIWCDKMGDYWTVEAHKPGEPEGSIFATSRVLSHALVFALLRAHGVEVESTS